MNLTPLTHSDLMYLAKDLPEVEGFDHEKEVFQRYEKGGFKEVDKYVEFIHEYMTLNKDTGDTIYLLVGKYIGEGILWLSGLLNRSKWFKDTRS